MKQRRKLSGRAPADALFSNMPEHVQNVYREAKALKRERDRKNFLLVMQGKEVPRA